MPDSRATSHGGNHPVYCASKPNKRSAESTQTVVECLRYLKCMRLMKRRSAGPRPTKPYSLSTGSAPSIIPIPSTTDNLLFPAIVTTTAHSKLPTLRIFDPAVSPPETEHHHHATSRSDSAIYTFSLAFTFIKVHTPPTLSLTLSIPSLFFADLPPSLPLAFPQTPQI